LGRGENLIAPKAPVIYPIIDGVLWLAGAMTAYRPTVSVAAEKGTSLAVETEPLVRLRNELL